MKHLPPHIRFLLTSPIALTILIAAGGIFTVFIGSLFIIGLMNGMGVRALLVMLQEPLSTLACFFAFSYGAFRVSFAHPIFDRAYLEWLRSTPWTYDHPLPKGPLFFNRSDLIVLCPLTVATSLVALATSPIDMWLFFGPLLSYAAGVTLLASTANAGLGQINHVYAVIATPLVFAALPLGPNALLISPIIGLPIAEHGVRASLRRFPWHGVDALSPYSKKNSKKGPIAWPFKQLLTTADEITVPPTQAFIEAVLTAGWFALGGYLVHLGQPKEDLTPMFVVLSCIGTTVVSVGRIGAYWPAICSRLCWGRRLALRRFIIPEHDQIFIAPLLMIVCGIAIPWALLALTDIPPIGFVPPAMGVLVFIARTMGPSVRRLQLTGVHSKTGGLSNLNKEFCTPGRKA